MDHPVHLAERMDLPAPYRARRYRGRDDHVAMVRVLTAAREHGGTSEMPTVEGFDLTYANLTDCDPDNDIAIIHDGSDDDGEAIAYCRASFEDLGSGVRDLIVFTPTMPEHIDRALFDALVAANEAHMTPWARRSVDGPSRFRAYARHPGPSSPAAGESAWLEGMDYVATEWNASLVRPDLHDIPERMLPDGVELRPVTEDQIRTILEAHFEAFRGEWDFHEASESDFVEIVEDPDRDESMWKVAWVGDTVVGQVKSYISAAENAERGYLRGYTEDISTHRDWRNRGIAGALLAMSLAELRDRGMTEAALGVDTNNPGGAFQLYTSLGFQLRSYEAVYTKPVD